MEKTLHKDHYTKSNWFSEEIDHIFHKEWMCVGREEELKENGLIKGGSLDNAVVLIDKLLDRSEINRLRDLFGIEENIITGANGILNGRILRFRNEPVRHKTLDLIGDLALLGIPIKGHVTAARAGHASNVEFVKTLKREYSQEIKDLSYN